MADILKKRGVLKKGIKVSHKEILYCDPSESLGLEQAHLNHLNVSAGLGMIDIRNILCKKKKKVKLEVKNIVSIYGTYRLKMA